MRTFHHGGAGLALLFLEQASARALPESGRGLNHHSLARNSKIPRQETSVTVPAPITASVSQFWEGNDGPWSSFAIQVGKRPQDVRVLPSTTSTSTWVVYDEGCPADAPSDCADSRGRTFNKNNSQTWVGNSIFELGVDEDLLDREVFGDFGFDTLTLGWQGSGGPTVEHSIIAGIADTHFSWLGVLGLNPRPTNFSNNPQTPQVSFIQALKNQNSIPSLSWAYTAGAKYRLNSVYGSLVIGGYDNSRFTKPSETSPDLVFPFYQDISRDLLVGISSITTSNTTSSTSQSALLEEGIFAVIDSTVPHFWLPESACKAFESAFGLTWNSNDNLYTLNSSQHETLSKLNPSIKFKLSPSIPPSATDQVVFIELPYSAFDLNLSWPHANSSTYYFPLKRASSDTQYTLGRAFLQETYLIADYERQMFSVWPCKWDSNTTNSHIIAITSTEVTNSESNNTQSERGSKKSLSTGAIAGIAVGAAVGGFAVCVAIWVFVKRRSNKDTASIELERAQTNSSTRGPPSYHPHKDSPGGEIDSIPKHELHEDHRVEAPEGGRFEMDSSDRPHEADSNEKGPIYEMDAQGDGAYFGSKLVVPETRAATPGSESVLPSPVSTGNESIMKPESKEPGKDSNSNQDKEQVRSFAEFFKVFKGSKK